MFPPLGRRELIRRPTVVPVLRPLRDQAGQPIDDPPPLIEPVGFADPPQEAGLATRRAPRRSFLAPPPAAPAPEPDKGAPVDIPPLIEPIGFTEAAPVTVEPEPVAVAPMPVAVEIAEPERRDERQRYGFLRAAPRGHTADAALRPIARESYPEDEAARDLPHSDAIPPAPERLAALPADWAGKAWRMLPAARWARLGLALCAVLVLLVGIADVARIGPFSPIRQYRASAPPNDPTQRLAYYQSGAQAGDPNAELQLAILYAKGVGVAQDYATAATWFRAAANQGNARAQYDLGVLYERGRGVPTDQVEAANWYLKGAEGKYPLAEYNLAVCYTKGQGIRKDLAEAALWYRRAATHGVVQAMSLLGTMYEKGDGVSLSTVDAYAWYRAAGKRDNQPAARRADDLFAAMPQLDQIRAQALASDVEASIHDPEPERAETARMEKN
jgi:hypothetical protein